MFIPIKTNTQQDKMREAGKLVALTLQELEDKIVEGITTLELNEIALQFIKKQKAKASFLGYSGYKHAICASVNDEVIHGIPSNRILKNGDIISIDIGVKKDGYHGDAARTFIVGKTSEENEKLISVTKQSFFEAVKVAISGNYVYDISVAIDMYVKQFNYGIVEEFVGHGIGKNLHEAPEVPNYAGKNYGVLLKPGMTIAIEPMVNLGTKKINVLDDGWTVITQDGRCSAHYENTILITNAEPEILTIL